MSTKINWTNETWNPIIGCSKISPGCKNCYAEKMAYRLAHIEKTEYYKNVIKFEHIEKTGIGYEGFRLLSEWNGKTHLQESQLNKPIKWKKPRMIFVCSMGDLFHESVNLDWIDEIMKIIIECPQHTFQILTKRPEIMKQYFEYLYNNNGPYFGDKPIKNLWLGVTAENQEQANKRIPILLQIPAKIRFVSVEPMLNYVRLTRFLPDLDWVICGGESGHNARPMHPDWVWSLKEQCEQAEVPFFFKQWGEWVDEFHIEANDEYKINDSFIELTKDKSDYKGIYMYKIGKKKAGSLIDGKEYKQFPKI